MLLFFFVSDFTSMAGLRCITLAAVPLALFALQYTQIISFVMISPPLESCTVGCYEHKNETFGPSEVRRRGGGSCKILGMPMTLLARHLPSI